MTIHSDCLSAEAWSPIEPNGAAIVWAAEISQEYKFDFEMPTLSLTEFLARLVIEMLNNEACGAQEIQSAHELVRAA